MKTIILQQQTKVIFYILLFTIACNLGKPLPGSKPYIHPFQADPMNINNIAVMQWQDSNNLWIGNREGVARINPNNGQVDIFDDISCGHSLFITNILTQDIWCNASGVYANKFDGQTWQRFDITAYSFVETADGKIWVGTSNGLAYFEPNRRNWINKIDISKETSSKFTFTDGAGIHLSFQSVDGYLWFYSYHPNYVGVNRWQESFNNTWLPINDYVMVKPMLETNTGDVWAGSDEGFIVRWDGQTWTNWQPFRLKPAILSMLEDDKGNIWVLGTVDGIARWDGENWAVWARDETILQNCPNTKEEQDCFTPEENTTYFAPDGLGLPIPIQTRLEFVQMIQTQDSNIWVATNLEGISRWNGNSWYNYTTADGLSSNEISVLAVSPGGELWAGTKTNGLNYYDSMDDRWYQFSPKNIVRK